MVRYIALLKFTPQGAKTLNKSTTRAIAFRKVAAKAGVKVEGQFWTTGSRDGVLLFSAEKETNILRCLAALAAAGNVRTETLRAFDATEFAAISRK